MCGTKKKNYRRIGLSGACTYWDNSKTICATLTKCAKYWGSKVGHTSKIVMSWQIVGQNQLNEELVRRL